MSKLKKPRMTSKVDKPDLPKIKEQLKLSCSICGVVRYDTGHYLDLQSLQRKFNLFITLMGKLFPLSTISRHPDDEGSLICLRCAESIKTVWNLSEDIKNIRKKLEEIFQQFAESCNGHNSRKFDQQHSPIIRGHDCLNLQSGQGIDHGVSDEDDFDIDFAYRVETIYEENATSAQISVTSPPRQCPSDATSTQAYRRHDNSFIIPSSSSHFLLSEQAGPSSSDETSSSSSSPEVCPHCENTYTSRHVLARHVREVHTKIHVKVKCDLCLKWFYDQRGLKNHVTLIHQKGGFPCSHCDKRLSTEKIRAIHEVTVCKVVWDRDKLDELGVKLYHCEYQDCNRVYGRPKDFRKHRDSHWLCDRRDNKQYVNMG